MHGVFFSPTKQMPTLHIIEETFTVSLQDCEYSDALARGRADYTIHVGDAFLTLASFFNSLPRGLLMKTFPRVVLHYSGALTCAVLPNLHFPQKVT